MNQVLEVNTKELQDKLMPCDNRRMLVADDDKQIREMFQLVLSCDLPEYRLDLAVNGAEVIEIFRSAHPGIIVIDVRMPVIDGEEAFCDIRGICEAENLVMPSFVFCTGFDPPHGLQNVVAENPSHCILRKPIDPSTLVDALKVRLSH
ncbi:response regulator [Verrucomicrobiota bacterium]